MYVCMYVVLQQVIQSPSASVLIRKLFNKPFRTALPFDSRKFFNWKKS